MKAQKQFLFLFLCAVLTCFQMQAQKFQLEGTVKGENITELYISYSESKNNVVFDTLKVIEHNFYLEGKISEPTILFISSNLSDTRRVPLEEPNSVFFFIDPTRMNVTLQENNFNNLRVTGSKTQTEFEATYIPSLEIVKVLDELNEKKKELHAINIHSGEQLDQLNLKTTQLLDSMYNLEIDYALQHPKSFVSPYLLNRYKNKISKDTLQQFYNNLASAVQQSFSANKIKQYIDIIEVHPGDMAPDFQKVTADGQSLSLKDLRGKYVLLDFWAGWCKPCIEKHPELKQIYREYSRDDFEIIGVSYDYTEKDWKESITKFGTDQWPNIFVGFNKATDLKSLGKQYNIQPIPAYILIDKEGRLYKRYLAADYKNLKRNDINDLKNDLATLIKQ